MKFAITCLAVAVLAFATPSFTQAADANVTSDAFADVDELNIGIVIYDQVFSLDYVGPSSYFEFVNLANKTSRFTTIANRTGHIQHQDQAGLFANYGYADEDVPTKFDILMIPGGLGVDDVRADAAFVDYVKRAGEDSTFVLSICTGANILASTGLLDGRNATTNKRKFKKIAALHPKVEWVRKARWVVDGKFWTSSGVTAGLDMGHAFYSYLFGKTLADQAAALIETVPITDPDNDPFEYVIDLN